jgi:hypothetical protein
MLKNKLQDIWRHVQKNADNECWPYIGSTFNGRYGRFFLNRKSVGAHCAMYELVNGSIPSKMVVMHKCNNKLCCNPLHLTIGTNKENQLHASHSGAFNIGASGIYGISFIKSRNYWSARANGERINLYTGPSKEKAIAARKKWEAENLVSFQLTTTGE